MQGFPFSIRWKAQALSLALACLSSAAAHAGKPSQEAIQKCMSSHEQSQRLRMEGKLRQAMAEALACQQEPCPAPVREECTQFHADMQRSVPTVVVGVRDAKGRDLTDVRVMVDGELLQDGLTGKPVPIDPGKRVFRIVGQGGFVSEEEVLVRQGEKDRLLSFTLGARSPSSAASSPSIPVRADASERSGASSRAAGYVAGGVGVIALLVGGYFGLRARSRWSDRNDHCSPAGCDAEAVEASDDAHTSATIANVAVGLGLLSLGVGTYLIVTAPPATAEPSYPVKSALGTNGMMLGLGGVW